jgi:diacylglycerol kinase (ATP)
MQELAPPPRQLPVGVAVVANPYSGARENRQRVDTLQRALAAAGLDPRPMWQLGELEHAAAQPAFSEEFRCVVAAGGDGTLNRVINQQTAVPLAVLPLGNENLFARQFGFRDDPQALAAAIVNCHTRPIDLGRAGNTKFSIVASAGFDGEVAHRLASWRKRESHLRRVNSLSYVGPIMASVGRYRYPTLEVQADDERIEGVMAMVFNLPCYCTGLKLAPDACGDDGWLNWVVFRRAGRVPLARYVAWALLGRLRNLPDVAFGRARRIRMHSEESVPIEIDGEAADFTPLDVEVVPAGLRVIVP